MISFYLLWTGCYFVLLHWMMRKWPNQPPEPYFNEELPSVTLLIPVRNERENLDTLFSEITKLVYPSLSIFLIDDRSEDGSSLLMKEKAASDSRITILENPGIGKKSALEFGVENASSAIILCSDADCRFPEGWVRKMVAPFSSPKIQLVSGPVLSSDQDTFFQRFQQIEWASILLVTQYLFSVKRPLMCSAANLAYRKSAFLRVKGYSQNRQHLSGDDEFLLKKIIVEFGRERCVYLPFSENLVLTRPQPGISNLINQRVRWAGKWRMHRGWSHALSSLSSFLVQWIWLWSFALLGFGWRGVLGFLVVWLGKIGAERIALGRILGIFGFCHSILDYIRTGVLHPFYVLTVAVGALRGKFVWKGRGN